MSSNAVKAAFEKQLVVLPIDIIVPAKGNHYRPSKRRVLSTANRLVKARRPY